jgi:hypothetical protein
VATEIFPFILEAAVAFKFKVPWVTVKLSML